MLISNYLITIQLSRIPGFFILRDYVPVTSVTKFRFVFDFPRPQAPLARPPWFGRPSLHCSVPISCFSNSTVSPVMSSLAVSLGCCGDVAANRTGHTCSTVWGLKGPEPNLHQRLLAA